MLAFLILHCWNPLYTYISPKYYETNITLGRQRFSPHIKNWIWFFERSSTWTQDQSWVLASKSFHFYLYIHTHTSRNNATLFRWSKIFYMISTPSFLGPLKKNVCTHAHTCSLTRIHTLSQPIQYPRSNSWEANASNVLACIFQMFKKIILLLKYSWEYVLYITAWFLLLNIIHRSIFCPT